MGNKSIGGFIAVLRKARGMTQQELAVKLNISNKTVSKWECDETYPDISLIPVIAEILEVSCDELLKGERIFNEDKSQRSDKKPVKQMRHLIDKSLVKFKLYSIINVTFLIIGVLVNYILSYSAYRPDIGFGIMIGIFIVCIALEIAALITLSGKYADREWFTESGVDYENLVNPVRYKYSFAVFYLAFFLIFLTLPLIFARIFLARDYLPVKSVLALSEYVELLPYFLIIPIVALLPAQSLYKGFLLKDCAPKIDKKIIAFEIIQLLLMVCTFAVGYYNVYFSNASFSLNILPISILSALVIVGGTLYFLLKNNKKDAIFITSVRNIIYLFCPLLSVALPFYLICLLIIITTAVWWNRIK